MFLNDIEKIKKITAIKILYAEDDSVLQNEVIKFMRKLQVDITAVSNAQDALVMLENNTYEIIITDLTMPHLSALEFIKLVQATNPQQSFIVVSAYNDTNVIQQLSDLCVKEILNKPFYFSSLLTSILNILEDTKKL